MTNELNKSPPKTANEVADLKQQWLNDPAWDIETTEGFEAHAEELLTFRLHHEQRWQKRRNDALLEKAEQIGCPGNIALALKVESLELSIKSLQRKIEELQ